jgi:acetylornithine deacetylase/succinyl-diaminopimelate desuccinylase-like protein
MNPAVSEYYASGKDRFLDGLKEFLRIPSVSTLPEHKPDILRAAQFLVDELTAMEMKNVRLIEGLGNPLVSAEWLEAPGKPTLLLYGHYDVQPPDPLDEWISRFAATISSPAARWTTRARRTFCSRPSKAFSKPRASCPSTSGF